MTTFPAGKCPNTDLWCLGAELNHRHIDFQSTALPTELPRQKQMATRDGFEPTTSSVTGWHSNQLNYRANGGNNRARTYDPLLVRQMLSQLSYAPKRRSVSAASKIIIYPGGEVNHLLSKFRRIILCQPVYTFLHSPFPLTVPPRPPVFPPDCEESTGCPPSGRSSPVNNPSTSDPRQTVLPKCPFSAGADKPKHRFSP